MKDGLLLQLLETYSDPTNGASCWMSCPVRVLQQHRIRAVAADEVAGRPRAPAPQAPNYVLDACRYEALDLTAPIELRRAQLDLAEGQLGELLAKHQDGEILLNLPWIAERRSVRGAAEAGDRGDRFEELSSLRSIARPAPVTRRSGTRGVVSSTIRKGRHRVLQAAMVTAARSSPPASGWGRPLYDQARARWRRDAAAVRALFNK